MKSPAATAALSSVRAANRSARNRARRAQQGGGGPHSYSSSPSSSRGGAIPGRPVDDAHDDRPPSAARILRAWRLAASAPNGVAAALGEGADPARALGSVLDALLVAGAVDDACDVLREALDANVRVPAAYLERVTRAWTKTGDEHRGGGEGGEGDANGGGGAVGRDDGRGRRRLDASPTGGGVRTLETLVRAFEAFVDSAREPPTLRAYTDVIAALAKAESTGRELAFSASYRGRYAASYREEEEEEEEAEAEAEGEGTPGSEPASSASKTTTSQSPARLATALWRELRRSPSPALAPDAKAYTAAAMAFAALGDFEAADGLIREMTRRRVPPDARLFNVLIAARGRAGDLAGVRAAEAQMRAFSVRPNAATHGARVAAYALGCDRVDLAARALDSGAADPDASRRPGVRAYTALAQGLARDRRPEEALAVLARMRREGVAPNAWSYTVVVDGFVKAGDVERAAEVIEEMRRRGVDPTAVTYNTLLNAPGTRRTSRAKTALKSSEGSTSSSGKDSSAKAGSSDGSSRKAAEEAKRGGVSSSEDRSAAERRAALSSSSSSSSSSEEAAALERRRSTTAQTPPASPPPPASPQTPPASPPSSVPSSRLDSFRSVLDSMRLAGVDATAVTYNALIDACVSAGEPTEAMFALLSAMVDAGHRPDVVTYTTLLKHFGRDGDVVAARWLMREMQADETVAVDAASWNAFVDALARAGAFEEAAEVISREMTYSAAAGKGGKGGKVGVGVGVAPDRATYGALADGLARAGAFETLASLRDALMGRGAGEDGRGWTLSTYTRSDGGGGGGAVATTTRDFSVPAGAPEPDARFRAAVVAACARAVAAGPSGPSGGEKAETARKVAEGVVADAAREGRDAEAAELKTLFRRERAKAAAARSRARRGRATLTRVTRGSRGASSSSPRRTRGFERSAAAAEKGGTGEGSEEKAAPSSEVAAAPSSEVAAAPSSEASDPSPPRPAAGPGGLEMWKHWLGLPSQYYAGEDAPPTVAEAKEYAASREASASSNSGASSGAKNPSDAASSDAPPPSPGNTTTPPRRYSREDIAEAVKLLRLAAERQYPGDPEAALEAALSAAEAGDARRVEEAAGRMRREAEKSRRVDEAVRRLRSAAASKFPDDPEAALEAALRAAEEGDARGVVVEGEAEEGELGEGEERT